MVTQRVHSELKFAKPTFTKLVYLPNWWFLPRAWKFIVTRASQVFRFEKVRGFNMDDLKIGRRNAQATGSGFSKQSLRS